MQKILVLFFIMSTLIFASYNPFFTDIEAEKAAHPKVKYIKVEDKPKPKPLPPRQNITMMYIGFIETNKGIFALVTFNGKNIVIQKNDSLYSGTRTFKVKKISSNYVLLKDNTYRTQKVYFTSESRYNNKTRYDDKNR